jgi:hypothetical protein
MIGNHGPKDLDIPVITIDDTEYRRGANLIVLRNRGSHIFRTMSMRISGVSPEF